MSPTREEALALDRSDPLARKRAEFLIPEGLIYLDGNSLGVLPGRVPGHLERVVREQWGTDLIRSWNKHGWIDLPQRVGARIARLIGAAEGEVLAADSTSINLFKLLLAALRLRPERRVILSDLDNFPTDLYIAQGVNELLGGRYSLRFVKSHELESALDEQVAVVLLTQVDYRTGALYDLEHLTHLAHRHGALILWDLAHSAGALPVDLNGCGADFAVGCGYKYLNGGPGAPAFLFVPQRHQAQVLPYLSGWMGHKAPFAFSPWYEPGEGLRRMMVGTPHVLSLSALEAALELFEGVDMKVVREKSLRLSGLFIDCMEPLCREYGLELVTPREGRRRGSHVSYAHPEGYALMQALIEAGVVGDFRAPNLLRFGFTPLYVRYEDVYEAVERLHAVLREERWREPRFTERARVT